MITKSQDKQLSLAPDGQIFWQAEATNPTPGKPIGRVLKGEGILKPSAEVDAAALPEGEEAQEVQDFVQSWAERYLRAILAPLFTLTEGEGLDGPAQEIAQKVYGALGILPREEIQGLIDQITEEGRAALRKRKLRMGPLLVYLPELNKPACVRLQALVWNLWHGGALPAEVPADGIVSFSVRDRDADAKYFRAIGYPVYGPRAIRVDMLDRVVCAVYDGAKDGKFQAQHQMAEWLGSNIADLYDVLESMGHTKIYDPLEEKIRQETQALETAQENAPAEKPDEAPPKAEVKSEDAKPQGDARPELATFRLKRGKASEKAQPREKKPAGSGKPKPKFKKPVRGKKPEKKRETVIRSGPAPKPEDSPFAVLQKLKLGNDDK